MPASPATRDAHPADEPFGKPARFTWPPKPPVDQQSSPQRDAAPEEHPLAEPPRAPIHWWSIIEEQWFGRVTPPLRERIWMNRWRPDPLSAFCPRCGRTVGFYESVSFEGEGFGCPECRRKRLPWSRFVRLGPHDGLLRDAIHETKFTAFRRTGETLGELLGSQLLPPLQECGISAADARLVPVPISYRRRVSRGVDHTLALARGMRRTTGIPILRALSRTHTPSQRDVPTSKRSSNVKGSMCLRRRWPANVRLLIMVDDVLTTGATAKEACRAFREPSRLVRILEGVLTQFDRNLSQSMPDVWFATCTVASDSPSRASGTQGSTLGNGSKNVNTEDSGA